MAELIVVLTLLSEQRGADKQRVTLTTGGKPFVLGRGADADMRIDKALLSRKHCELHLVEAGLELRDLGSANGTTVNGKTAKTVVLKSGDLLRLGGDVLVRVEYGPDVPLPPPTAFDKTPRNPLALPPTARLRTPAPVADGPATGLWLTSAAEGTGDLRCKRCERRISMATMSDGLAFEWGEDVFCPECREVAKLEQFPAAMELVTRALAEEGFTDLTRLSTDGTLSPVFRARHWGLDVAVKALPILPGVSRKRIDRFKAEARAMARIKHPNVAAILDVKERPDVIFFVMDLIQGESLLEKIERLGKLPAAEASSLALALARALEATAKEGIVHRNVKPANILLSGDAATPKLVDFGVAKDLRLLKAFTGTEETLGTIRYMAPEQVKDARKADARSDIYSLGATLYQAFTGKLPYPRHTELDLLKSAVTGRLPDFGPTPLDDIPEAVSVLLRRCLKRNPADRPESATKLLEELTLATAGR